ncbi:MAG: TatD family hydrolase [Spirochaetales bacterium]|nr:TatD family hydrolase [Spirochaetales bacterium]
MNAPGLPTLDAHCHLDSSRTAGELDACGAVLAMTLSPDEFEAALARPAHPFIARGAGCHPGVAGAQEAFNPERFRRLAEKAAVVGEIGLDKASTVPIETQVRTFRAILAAAAELGRPVSVHSRHATGLVIDELERARPPAVILHWWLGSAALTSRAVGLGCWFSIHSSIARQSRFRAWVPVERVLVETDQAYEDPPSAVPPRIEQAENILAEQYKMEVIELRRRIWMNFGAIVARTGVSSLLPGGIAGVLGGLGE